jgi:hypothetical protein
MSKSKAKGPKRVKSIPIDEIRFLNPRVRNRRNFQEIVPKDKIARALDINVRSISRKVQLVDGICGEAIGLLKDKMCPMAIFDVLRKMNPLRQIETAELLINANNFSISYASAILAGTPQAQLVTPQTSKRLKGMTAEAIARWSANCRDCRKRYLRFKIPMARITYTSPWSRVISGS